MKILFCHADTESEWNCSEWRCVIPAIAINTLEGHEARLTSLKNYAMQIGDGPELATWADVIVIQRNLAGIVLSANEYWKAMGKIIVLDIDDDYQHMPPDINTYKYWIMGQVNRPEDNKLVTMQYKPYDQLKWGMKLVHAVTTPSDIIAQDWRYLNPNTFTLPNYIDFQRYDFPYKEIDKPRTIGWGGSLSHQKSFRESGILTALNRVLDRHKDLNFVVAGDAEIFKMIKISMIRKKWLPWMRFSQWPITLFNSIDIGLAPLCGTYDKRRSWIKVLEYMAEGIPCVATDYPSYQSFADCIALVDNKPNKWEEAIENIIENYPAEREKAKGNIERAKLLDARANATKIISVYETIRERSQ